jgi:hypothetical protein
MSRASFKANRAASQAAWEVRQLMTPIPPDHPSQVDPRERRRQSSTLAALFGLAATLSVSGGPRR